MVIKPLSKRGETVLKWVLSPLWLPLVALLYIDHGVRWIAARIGRRLWPDRSDWSPCFAWWPTYCDDPDDEAWRPVTVWLEPIERCEIDRRTVCRLPQ
jgi:hypothetical protein